MKKIIKLLIIVLVLPLSGCWDSTNLEDLLIVYGLGIDVSSEKPDNFLFTMGFPTIIEEAAKDKSEFSTEAPSLGEGKGNLQKKAYRSISYDNIKVVVFGESAAKLGILQHVDSMLREPLFRGTTKFTVVKDRAVELLNMEVPVSLLVSTFISDSIKQNNDTTTVPISTIRKFSNQYYTIGIEPSMPFICYGENSGELKVGCIALFKGDKFIHQLKGVDSRSFMFLIGEINEGLCTYDWTLEELGKMNYISINLKGGSSKITTKLIDSELHIYQEIKIKSTLAQYTGTDIIFTKEKIEEMERHISKEMKKDLENTLKILQKELKNDNVGYGKYVKANHPEFFDKENWNHQFSEANIHVNPTVNIRTVGITP